MARMTLWPGLMRRDKAARYCDMTQAEFERAIANGGLPQPVMINRVEYWRKADIDGIGQASDIDDWRARSPLYAQG